MTTDPTGEGRADRSGSHHATGRPLPPIDVHTTLVRADTSATWDALVTSVEEGFTLRGARTYARVVGCEDVEATGPRPLAVGSTIPGFHVTAADVGTRLELVGRHSFADYSFAFALRQTDQGIEVRAETRAAFPGFAGRLYRLLVIGTRGHVLVVRAFLATTRRRAERGRWSG